MDTVQSPTVAVAAARKASRNVLPIDGPDEMDKTFEDPEAVIPKRVAVPEVVNIRSAPASLVSRRSDARHKIVRTTPGQAGLFAAKAPVVAPAAPPVALTTTPVSRVMPPLRPVDAEVKVEAKRFSGESVVAILPPAALEKRKVCLLLPMYKATSPATVVSLLGNWDRDTMGMFMNSGNALISEARNQLADSFLRSKFEWALWVDDDMILPSGSPGMFRKYTGWRDFPEDMAGHITINRLLSHGQSLVGAFCSGRNPWSRVTFSSAARDPAVAAEVRTLKQRELRAVDWVGTGVLLMHRSVLEDIQRHFPHLAPVGSPTKPGVWRFFSPTADGAYSALEAVAAAERLEDAKAAVESFRVASSAQHGVAGEDVMFCHRARASGHQPYVDLGLVCGHIGNAVYGPQNTTG